MDLILCRNVLIYFDRPTVAQIARRLFDSLAAGGVLLTAGSDPLLGGYAPFEVEMTSAGLLYRRPGASRAHPPPPVFDLPAIPLPVIATDPVVPVPDASPRSDDEGEAFARIMRAANATGALDAEVMARSAIARLPLDAHLHYLRATLLVALDRDDEAERESERALYLDPTLAVAHFLRGTILRTRGAGRDAQRAFRNARDLCAGLPLDAPLPAGSGERVGALAAAAAAEMESLGVNGG
jgi:chemotaxis protein methyltransferase CheR